MNFFMSLLYHERAKGKVLCIEDCLYVDLCRGPTDLRVRGYCCAVCSVDSAGVSVRKNRVFFLYNRGQALRLTRHLR